jgi:ABC-2 type transport system permease protein
VRHWLRSYGLLLRWAALRGRAYLVINLVVQTCLAAGIVIGFAYFEPSVSETTALYFSTGAPVLGLITVGMVFGPQELASAKQEGYFDFHRSLPVPRSSLIASDATIALATGLPGVAASLVLAIARFNLTLHVSLLVIPAFLLTALTCVGMGYAIGYGLKPEAARMISQIVVFVALMFSPILFPASRLPDWVARLHALLPFRYMADAIRETLENRSPGISALPFAVLAAWCAFGFVVAFRMLSRRL